MRIVFLVVATLVLFGANPNSARSQFIDEEFRLASSPHQLRPLTDSPRAADSVLVVSNQDSVFHWSHLAWQVAATQATFASVWFVTRREPEGPPDPYIQTYPNALRVITTGLAVPLVECIVGNLIYAENQSLLAHLPLSILGSFVIMYPVLTALRQFPGYWGYNFAITTGSIAAYYLLRVQH